MKKTLLRMAICVLSVNSEVFFAAHQAEKEYDQEKTRELHEIFGHLMGNHYWQQHRERAMTLLREGADPNECGTCSASLLECAVLSNDRDGVECLLASKADPNARDWLYRMVLDLAPSPEIKQLLIGHGAQHKSYVWDLHENALIRREVIVPEEEMKQMREGD